MATPSFSPPKHPGRLLRATALTALSALTVALIAGCNKAPDNSSTSTSSTSPPAPSTTLGTQVDDTVITAGVKAALLGDATVKSFDLQVETRQGTVQLSGFVDNQAQIDQALLLARGVAGVVRVDNGVTLKGAPTTLGMKVDDASVTGRVKSALLADPDIKSMDISVLTLKGEVQLTGFVNNQGQVDLAVKLARAAEGATGVKNELKIKR